MNVENSAGDGNASSGQGRRIERFNNPRWRNGSRERVNSAGDPGPGSVYVKSHPVSAWRSMLKREEDLKKVKFALLEDVKKRKEVFENDRTQRYKLLVLEKMEMHEQNAKAMDAFSKKETEFFKIKFEEEKQKEEAEGMKAVRKMIGDPAVDQELMQESTTEKEPNNNEQLKEDSKRINDDIFKETKQELHEEKQKVHELCRQRVEEFEKSDSKLAVEFSDVVRKFEREEGNLISEFMKKEQDLETDKNSFFVEFEKHMHEIEKRQRNMNMGVNRPPDKSALLDRIHYLERELARKDNIISNFQGNNKYAIMDKESKFEEMAAVIADLEQLNSDSQFEKLQLITALNDRDRRLGYVGSFSHQFEHEYQHQEFMCDPQFQHQPQFSASGEWLHGFQDRSKGPVLTDLRDRYQELQLLSYSNKSQEINWTLSMIQKVISYYENQGKCVYEESIPNRYISTLITVDKDDVNPNKLEGTFAIGNGDTPQEATQNAVQWAYGYIQTIIDRVKVYENLRSSSTGSIISEIPDYCTEERTTNAVVETTAADQVSSASTSLNKQINSMEEPELLNCNSTIVNCDSTIVNCDSTIVNCESLESVTRPHSSDIVLKSDEESILVTDLNVEVQIPPDETETVCKVNEDVNSIDEDNLISDTKTPPTTQQNI